MTAEPLSARKELLVKYCLADTVLDGLTGNLQQFEQLLEQASDARRQRVGASAELEVQSDETVSTVQVMHGFNRDRFGDNAELLAQWASGSNVVSPSRTAGEKAAMPERPKPGDQVRPAA